MTHIEDSDMEWYNINRVDKPQKIWYNKINQKEGKKMSKYSKEFKEEALKLSDEIGVKKAALQLGLQYYTLADWRKARKYAKKAYCGSDRKRSSRQNMRAWTWKCRASHGKWNLEGRSRFFRKRSEEVKTAERHTFVLKYKNRYTVKLMCKVLKISESGYYRWLKNKDKPSKRQLLPVKIKEILSEHPDNANYGYDRIHKALEIRGIKVSRQNTI